MDSLIFDENYLRLLQDCRSLILSTSSAEGIPHSSYAPFVASTPEDFYIFVSDLARHTSNLNSATQVGILLIDDESKTDEIFARKRASLVCTVGKVEREEEPYNQILDLLAQRQGETVNLLRSLSDFRLFHFQAREGTLVTGFGKALKLEFSSQGLIQA
ncbi:HugZ family protein [bacterium]|jgi:heme iron utilization protein|nr:HugZ family protein [bacterium]